jgi:DNA-binding FrmR family transcriptional regulator
VVKYSRKWYASPKPNNPHLAQLARARIPKRKSRLLLRLAVHSVEPAFLPAAVAVPAAASAERDNHQTGRAPVFFLENDVMKIQNPEAKEKLVQRLRRIEGQVHGVQTMLDNERDCREIMQQLAAIHSAVQSASRIFLQEYATACLVEMDEGAQTQASPDLRVKREKIIQDMIALLDKSP